MPRFKLSVLLAFAIASAATAQTPRPSVADSVVFARARQLVLNGNGAAGRLLVDSVVAATEPDSPGYAEALYWRATLAATSSDAERDYRRIVVDYPLSPRQGDALLQLAQLEVARGDRASAGVHLERFLLENPRSPEAGRAGLSLVRVSFELNDLPRGCVALARALKDVPERAVELRNQLDYYSPRCSGVDTSRTSQPAAAPSTASATTPTPAAKDSARRDSIEARTKAKYTLQVAAYKSRPDADALAKKLKARGIDARVAPTAKLYRVRVGRYETRAAAVAAAKILRAKKITADVTDIEPNIP